MTDRVAPEASSAVKRALVELRELRSRLDAAEAVQREPIAIVGLGCRFPGASGPDAFWTLLRDGVNGVSEIPASRWDLSQYWGEDPDVPGTMYARHGGFLEDIDRFDAAFFGITPREAASMDPQQRLLLEVCWEALEHGAQSPDTWANRPAGVFVGIAGTDYLQLLLRRDVRHIDAYMASGGTLSVAAGRIAYVLGMDGPALAVDTACSSSLTAVHLACQSLRRRECDLALAGGASLMLLPEISINFCTARMLAPDGRCKTFDAAADGYVRGEGCGVVVLKRLTDALASHDRILAVVRGSAINQDGRSGGLTVPSGAAQESVVRVALAEARLSPADVSYIETHGTGTPLGDPIELRALASVFRESHIGKDPLIVGSVKTNVGHLEASAGIAGLIKVVLMLQHREVPPHLHFERPTPHVDWADARLRVPAAREPWQGAAGRLVAGVSSFGFSGTNAHVVLEGAPEARDAAAADVAGPHVLVLSARTDGALQQLARDVSAHLDADPRESIADVCFTAATGRSHLEARAAALVSTREDARAVLAAIAEGTVHPALSRGRCVPAEPPPLAFLFTGQGPQRSGMGKRLYETEPVFRAALERAAAIVDAWAPRPLFDMLWDEREAASLRSRAGWAQPTLVAFEIALAELWQSWGVRPTYVMGHSLGEIAAAAVAGALSTEDALRWAARRGRVLESLPGRGRMLAVFADAARVQAWIDEVAPALTIGAYNGPTSVVVSGDPDLIEALAARVARDQIETRDVPTGHAYHSVFIDPVLDALGEAAADVAPQAPRVGLVSNVTGGLVGGELPLDAAYWRRHARQPVRFGDGLATLLREGCRHFLEIGPEPTLAKIGRHTSSAAVFVHSLQSDEEEPRGLRRAAGALHVEGVKIAWPAIEGRPGARRLALPTMPFERRRFWADGLDEPRPTGQASDAARTWSHLEAAGRRASASAPFDLTLASYPSKWATLEALTLETMHSTLAQLGVFTQAGERATPETVIERTGIKPAYAKLLRRWFDALSRRGDLRERRDEWEAAASFAVRDVLAACDAARPQFADYPGILEYLRRCAARLPLVLQGQESPLETLFPGGSATLAQGLYERSPVARYFNGILAGLVESLARDGGAGVWRALEIGAGTGGSTSHVLPVLQNGAVEYTFTDVSSFFLDRARERFASSPFVRYRLLDIEADPGSQGYPDGEMDAVIAANVIHATGDLRGALAHARRLLAPGGVLLLFETTHHPIWFDVTTGLIEGWQRFDDELRGDNPLLDAAAWARVLSESGFDRVAIYPEPGSVAEVLGQHVIAARVPADAQRRSVAAGERSAFDTGIHGEDGQPVETSGEPTEGESAAAFRQRLDLATPGERHDLIVERVWARLVRVLRLPSTLRVDPHARLMDLGIDSLMAVEFRNKLGEDVGASQPLPATLIFDHPTPDAIAAFLARTVTGEPDEAPVAQAAPRAPERNAREAAIEDLSEEEVEAMLGEKLDRLFDSKS